jgi:hypothetical protein
MKLIKLTQNKKTKIDNEDYHFFNEYKWYALYSSGIKNYYVVNYNCRTRKTLYLHRLIMNCPTNKCIDHINRNTLDNRKCNLRICTRSENQINRKCGKNKGVSYHKKHKLWLARIKKDKKTYYLGWFKNKEDGIKVYKLKAKELFGEFLCTTK